MQNDANSGWLYHLGDVIFGDVLLIDAEDLFSVLSIYASNVHLSSKTSFPAAISSFSISGFDCIIVNSTDGALPGKQLISEFHGALNNNGVIAVVYNNDTNYKNIASIKYPYSFVKKIFDIFKHSFFLKTNLKTNRETTHVRYYMQSIYGKINEVFYHKKYRSVKNPFLLTEKIKKHIFSPQALKFFSSNILDITIKGEHVHKSVIDNVIALVRKETGIVFSDIFKCTVIPYKVLVSVKSQTGDDYIFLLLRGADRNVRANRELKMLNYLNDTYLKLSPFISKSVTCGIYKKIEYIVYHKISGVSIDAMFDQYAVAERSAFNMLLHIGEISRQKIVFDVELFHEMTGTWFDRLDNIDQSSDKFEKYLAMLNPALASYLQGKSCELVLYHGDYKIENLIFNTADYSVNGIIDWDLSEKHHLPGMDLFYLIIYSRRIKNGTSFIKECEEIFLKGGFHSDEQCMLDEYCKYFNISDDMLVIITVLFIIHHFSSRERNGYTNIWLMLLLESIWSPGND
ncbi:hypothetical protein MNBD_GAMMA11-190 [hydrothermal vent metagenome]|uniref:Aminoglycoside phosphotransferase domain-containing protein n=1 Tax=hydrothermal vent metagenome TaxID=652676 RepID=A0A3B0WU20_9ZZZZ